MLIYLDANIVIYLIEQPAGFGPRATAYVNALAATNHEFLASDLTRLECRAIPLASGDLNILNDYDQFFQNRVRRVVQLTTAICDRATLIRGRFKFKIADCLHLAAAIETGCGKFLTNDLPLKRFPGIPVEILP